MKCPIDQTEMEEGKLIALAGGLVKWKKKASTFPIFGKDVVAYQCPKCGKIELKTREKK